MTSLSVRAAAALTIAFGLAPVSEALADDIYECTFEERGTNHGWVPTVVAVAVAGDSDEVLVYDPMIHDVHGQPISVKPSTNSDKRLTLKWTLTLEATNQSTLILTYDISIRKADLTAKMSGMPHGYDNKFSSQGSCTLTEGRLK